MHGPKAVVIYAVEAIGTFAGRQLSGGKATRRRQLRVYLMQDQDNETAGGLLSVAARTTLESKRTVQR